MMVDQTWWQSLLQIAINALFVGGALGLLGALYYAIRGRPYPPKRHPVRMVVVSLIVLALGGISFFLTRDLTAPRRVDESHNQSQF
jgi:hypothetical protein